MHLGFRNPRRSQIAPFGSSGALYLTGRFPASDDLATFHDALFVACPFAVTFGIAFVVFLFALGKANFELDPVFAPVHGDRDDGIALALDSPDQFAQLVAVEQQFAGPFGAGVDMGGGGIQR